MTERMGGTEEMTDTEAIRQRHAGEHWCDGPVGRAIYDPGTLCDAARETARADAAEAKLVWLAEACARYGIPTDLVGLIHHLQGRERAWKADAEALAEALKLIMRTDQDDAFALLDATDVVYAALAAHEARVKEEDTDA
jgi:hypothetical protein